MKTQMVGKLCIVMALGVAVVGASAQLPRSSAAAVVKALSERKAGFVMSVRFEPSTKVWEAITAQGQRTRSFLYADGTLKLNRQDELRAKPITAKITADRAIQIALRRLRGTVLSAELGVQGDRKRWSVLIHAGVNRRRVIVDAESGAVLSVDPAQVQGRMRTD